MPFSFHSHSGQFCKHAVGNLEEVLIKAIELGFSHYGFSEHMPRSRETDLYEEEVELHMKPDDLFTLFDDYVKEARRLQDFYKDRIHVLVGMETEYVTSDYITLVKELNDKYKLDYIVGSVHHSEEIPIDFDEKWFNKAKQKCGSVENVIHSYLDHQYEIIKEIKPAVIGHFDLFRMYCKEFKLTESHWEKIRRNIQCCVDYDGLIEINSAGPRRGLDTPHPQEDIMKVMLSMGAKFTMSDDAHGPLAVGQLYSELFQYLKKMNIQKLHYLERDPQNDQVTIKELNKPLDQPFWKWLIFTGNDN